MPPFPIPSELVRSYRDRLHLSSKELAHRLNITQPFLSRITTGAQLPPMSEEKLEAWVAALELNQVEARAFVEAVHVAHASPVIRRLIDRLESRARARRR